MTSFLKILAVFLLVAGNAFFVAAEYALVTARRTRLMVAWLRQVLARNLADWKPLDDSFAAGIAAAARTSRAPPQPFPGRKTLPPGLG